ncbi:MAG: hypothetical protein CVU39_24465 [Chloroflexi bacterium HGW-Chloroflexi-10]|nr:MAG: hypothetical protein CVU39_24465 [Chloroflexi bacterium HGW-Chloroflexi-10]
MKSEKLNIGGYQGLPVPNTFFRQENPDNTHLAIVFPGLNYSSKMPGLYYPWQLMRSKGADVLLVEYQYNTSEFQSLPSNIQDEWIKTDAEAVYKIGSALRDYTQITLIGKSIGTLALGHLLESQSDLRSANWVWLTPILTNKPLLKQLLAIPHRGLFVIGTADRYYDPAVLAQLEWSGGSQSLVLPGADHGFEIPGKPLESLRLLQRMVEELNEFIA